MKKFEKKNMKNRNYFFILPLLLLPLFSAAQDIHFSQLTETSLQLNSAEAALGHDILAVINYKDQWRSISSLSAYKTFNVSGDFAVLKKANGNRLGIGVNVFSDK